MPRRVPAEIRNVSFPASVRGYDRRAVDTYVIRVNRLIAELEATRSPEAAITHALEQAEEQTGGIPCSSASAFVRSASVLALTTMSAASALARAVISSASRRAPAVISSAVSRAPWRVAKAATEAEEILAGSRKEAAEQLQRSQEEVAALREEAEAWVHELRADTEAIWGERRALLDDVREIAARLEQAAGTAAARFPSEEPAEPAEEGVLESAPAAATEQSGAADDDEPHEGTARRRDGPPGEKREAATGPDRAAS